MNIAKAWMQPYDLKFKSPVRTSRDMLSHKTSWFIFLQDENGNTGIGECAPIFGLSVESPKELEMKLSEVIYLLNHLRGPETLELQSFPSLRFAVESAWLDLKTGGHQRLFHNNFIAGIKKIKINGLIWMSSLDDMFDQMKDKIQNGFDCIKLKIGNLLFDDEIELLKKIRSLYGSGLELRLDANGAFNEKDVFARLDALAKFHIHSIEQPVKAGQLKLMTKVCRESPVPIALDEELIGVKPVEACELLNFIRPKYIILKPSLLGGLKSTDFWIEMAEKSGIGWWATSALESNIGLNVIAQWVSTKETDLYQGLGTGQLFSNNISSPLKLNGQFLYFDPDQKWDMSPIKS